MMKAAIVPAVQAHWEVQEVPIPEPQANQVLIKIHASGLCYTDVHITEGTRACSQNTCNWLIFKGFKKCGPVKIIC
jgi:D-arabinose 1-dehydrogenase-like Zn-dependent alcohol dehydrogenase